MRIPLKLGMSILTPLNSVNQTAYMNLACRLLRRNGFALHGSPLWISPEAYLETSTSTPTVLGHRSVISHGARLLTHDYSMDRIADQSRWVDTTEEIVYRDAIVIGDYAFVGMDAIVLPGISIGEGSVVAAGSVVTKDVAPASIVAGNPAREISSVGEWVAKSRHKFVVERRRK